MYNYINLNDVEFENLCKDIMEKKLSTKLRIFAKGRDGGIDLTDNTGTHNIIVQAKHYIGSKYPNLRSTLKKEIDNVKKLNPKQYYICCGLQLTDSNVKEIYNMFSSYMKSDQNIITLIEIDEFLQKPENADVVRKHYKLWLYSSNILNEVFNQNIFIDCEALLSDIEEESKYFVQTCIYEQCIDHLDKNGLLMITGSPGVGKTITSKMLVLYYSTQGFRIRYTTNGDITDIKKSLSHEKDSKEIVLLDDCLGQHYFNMKLTQESELLSLFQHVKLYKNKKLILNSRITIFNEAKDRSIDFSKYFTQKKIKNYIIDMDQITHLEKARIFYNHLSYKNIPKEYFDDIKKDKNYKKIIIHKNYTPRIIEHVTDSSNYQNVIPREYFNYIHWNLSNPNDIWKDEFERRLKVVDRVLLITLYSLTDTTIEYEVLKKCFESRLSHLKNVDYTINNYELVLSRLNQSIINIIDQKGKRLISVINPSVNDYLKSIFYSNNLELNEVRKSICNYKQLERCYSKIELSNVILELIESGNIKDIDFPNDNMKKYFISSHICEYNIKNISYKGTIFAFLKDAFGLGIRGNEWLTHLEVLEHLLDNDLYSYYSIRTFILDEESISCLLQYLELEELTDTINLLSEFYSKQNIKLLWFKPLYEKRLNDEIPMYVSSTNTAEYCDNYNIQDIVDENTDANYYIDKYAISRALKKMVVEHLEDEILEKLAILDEKTYKYTFTSRDLLGYVDEGGIDSYIDSYFEPDYMDDDDRRSSSTKVDYLEIDVIFDR